MSPQCHRFKLEDGPHVFALPASKGHDNGNPAPSGSQVNLGSVGWEKKNFTLGGNRWRKKKGEKRKEINATPPRFELGHPKEQD